MESNNRALTDQLMANANARLRALKVEPATPPLPAHVQANLLRAFKAQQAAATVVGTNSLGLNLSGWRNTFAAHVAPLFAVMVVVAGTAGIFMSAQQNTADRNDNSDGNRDGWESPRPEGSPLAGKIGHLQAPFIALKDINLIALELNTTIVETQLSPMQLVRLGLSVNPSNTASAIPAQVLMSDSGEALALKLDY